MKRIFTLLLPIIIFSSLVSNAQPSTQPSNIQISPIPGQPTQMRLDWTASGSGNKVLVIIRNSSSSYIASLGLDPAAAVVGTAFPASDGGAGDLDGGAVANGGKIAAAVYNGTGTSVNVTGLSGAVQYTIKIYEYTGTGATAAFNQAGASGNAIDFTYYTSGTSTWMAPTGISNNATVYAWGGGGGSGNKVGGTAAEAGGGGGGFTSGIPSPIISAGTSYKITAGAGGATGNSTGGSGGGSSKFSDNANTTDYIVANGGGGGAITGTGGAAVAGGAGGAASVTGLPHNKGGDGGARLAGQGGGGGGGSAGSGGNGNTGGTATGTTGGLAGSAGAGSGGANVTPGAAGGSSGDPSGTTSGGDGNFPGGGGGGEGNSGTSSGNGAGGLVIVAYSGTAPGVAIGPPSLAYANGSSTVSYTITYTGASTINLTTSNVTLNASGASGTVGITNGTSSPATVTISGITGNGTLGITIKAGSSSDALLAADAGAGPSTTFVVDTQAPGAPTNPPVKSPVGNFINSSEASSGFNIKVDLTGTSAVANDKVRLLLGGVDFSAAVLYTLTLTDISNTFAIVPIPAGETWGADGSKSITARVEDQAGNVGAVSSALSLTLDTQALTVTGTPVKNPVGTFINASEQTGGFIVRVPLGSSGVASNDKIRLFLGGVDFAPTPVLYTLTSTDISNTYADVPVVGGETLGADGGKSITATAVDQAGNNSPASPALSLTLDTQVPIITFTAPAASTSVNNTNVSYSLSEAIASGTIKWAGTAGPDNGNNHAQALTLGELAIGAHTGITLANDPTLMDGSTYTITFDASDAAGNNAATITHLLVVYDVTPPSAPTNPPVKNPVGSYINASEATSGFIIRVDLIGSGAANNDKVRLLLGGVDFSTPILRTLNATDISNTYADVTVPAGEAWGADGSKSITARVEDQATNVSAASPALTLTLDTQAPGFSATAPTSNSYVNNTMVSYTLSEAIASGTITWTRTGGTADATHTQALSNGAGELTMGAHSSITLSNNPTLVNASIYKIDFNGTDAAGNNSSTVTSTIVEYDNSTPAAPAAYSAVTTVGTIVANYWNGTNLGGTNAGVNLVVNIPNDVTLTNGTVEVEARISSGSFASITTFTSSTISAVNTSKTITIDDSQIALITGYGEGASLQFHVRFHDRAGNISSYTQTTNSLFVDTVAPTISTSLFHANSNNRETINITFSETLDLTSGVPISTTTNGNPGFYSNPAQIRTSGNTAFTASGLTLESNSDGSWTATVQITYTNSGSNSLASKYVRDVAGNELATVAPFTPGASPPQLESSMVLDPNNGANETISFTVDQTLNLANNATVNGLSVNGTSFSGKYTTAANTITITAALGTWDGSALISYNSVTGNIAGATGVGMLTFSNEPILLYPLSIASNNATNTSYAKIGDKVTLTFNANRAISTPSVTIDGVIATVSGSTNPITAFIITTGTNTTGLLAWQIVATEASRSTTITKTDDGSIVTFDQTAPTVTSASIVSNNSTSTAYAKPADIVTVNFTVSETLSALPTATIDGKTATVVNVSGLNYKASVTTDNTYTNGVLAFNINISDLAGNTGTKNATTDASKVTFDNVPPVATSIAKSSTLKGVGITNGIVACPTCSNTHVDFLVTFTETNTPLTGIDATDFIVSTTGTVTYSIGTPVLTTPTTYTVPVNITSGGTGEISLGLTDNNTIIDVAGNPLDGAADGSIPTAFTGTQYYSIVLPEPGNQVYDTHLQTTSITGNSISLLWGVKNTSTPLPTAYLVMIKPTSGAFPATPGDGVFVNPNGSTIQTVTRIGNTNTATFSGLASGTSYDFIVYKYAWPTNTTNDNVDYELTSATVTSFGEITAITNTASVSWITDNTPASPTINSIKDSKSNSATVLKFNVYDDGVNPISPNVMTLHPNGVSQETITFTLTDQLSLGEGAAVTGFTSTTGSIATAIYSGKGTTNTITLTNGGADGTWTAATAINYSATTGNAIFNIYGKMQSISSHIVASATDNVTIVSAPGSGTFTVPLGVTSIQVEVWGGGGSGGEYSIAYPTPGSSGGGGGGGYSRSFLSVTPLTVFSYTVGAGGQPRVPVACCAFGNNGLQTTFGGSLVQAGGGYAGLPSAWYGFDGATDANPPYTHGGVGTENGGQGGYGQTGVGLSGGGGGSSAGSATVGVPGTIGSIASSSAGGTAPIDGGAGGTGVASGPGGAGASPGGGGGGVGSAFNSGAGADGQIRITYSLPAAPGADDWAADTSPFKFSQLVITNTSSPAIADWSQIIDGAELTDGTNTWNTTDNGTANVQINPTNITFTNIPSSASGNLGYIDDANGGVSFKTYTLNIWLKSPASAVPMTALIAASIDGKNLAFTLDATAATGNLTYTDATSSKLASPEPKFSTVQEPIQVFATELDFSTSPNNPTNQLVLTPITAAPVAPDDNATIGNAGNNPVIRARDKNGNTDLNFSASGAGAIVLSSAVGTTSTSVSMASGISILSGVQYLDQGNGTLTASTSTLNASSGVVSPGVSSILPSPTSVVYSQGTIITTAGIAPLTVSSLATTGAGTAVFDFTVTDDNGVVVGTDGAPTLIDNFVITKGTGNTVTNWNDAIASASLTIYDGTSTTSIPATSFNTNSITFSNLLSTIPVSTDNGYIKDNKYKTFTLKIVLRSPMDNTTEELDDEHFVFRVDQTLLPTPSIILNSKSSAFAANQKATSGSGNGKIDVQATQLDFTTQWAAGTHQYYDATLSPIPHALARDVNGNLDVDWNTAPLPGSGLTASPNGARTYPLDTSPTGGTLVTVNNGVFTFDPSLRATSGGNGLLGDPTHLILKSGALTSPVSPALGKANSFILDYDDKSDIIRETTFAYPTNILYSIPANQVTDIGAATGVQMDRYTIRDGGGASDLDGTATKLSSITIRVNNYQYLQRIALYEVGTSPFSLNNEIIEIDATSASPNIAIVTLPDANNIGGVADYTFTGITSFSAPDNGSKDNNFVIKCSFLPTVVDNQAISFQIMSLAASSSSSIFANPAPASVQSAAFAGNEDKIEVVATQIVYTTVPPNASLNVPFPVVVQAQDANGNLDLDYNGPVQTFSTDQSNGTFVTANGPVAGNLFAAGVLSFQYNPGPPPPATGFQFTTGNGNTFLTLVSGLGTTVGSTNNTAAISGSSPIISILTSFDSWMYFDPTFAYTTEIDFVPFQNGSTSSSSQALGQVILSDGGAPGSTATAPTGSNPSPGTKNQPFGKHDDADGAFTEISDFTISLTNHTDINHIGLYTVGGVQIGGDYTPTPGGTVTFSGLNNISYQAQDNDVNKFIIRAEFKSAIVDQTQIVVQITAVTPSGGSKFPENNIPAAATIAGIAGGDATPSGSILSGGQNFLDVRATSLDFTTFPSLYAGINEPLGPSYTTAPLPSTTAGIVTARDQFMNVDTGFAPTSIMLYDDAAFTSNPTNPPYSLIPPAGGLSFTSGVMSLDGMSYPVAVGNKGKITVKTTGPTYENITGANGGNAIACSTVNVLDVSVSIDTNNGVQVGIGNPPAQPLKGGQQGVNLFGLKFTANATSGAEPQLKQFTISFKAGSGPNNWYEDTQNSIVIFSGFKVFIGGTANNITTSIGGSFAKASSQSNQYLDQIVVTLGTPQTIGTGLQFYLVADVDPSTNTSTQTLIPYFVDAGYGTLSDKNSIVTNGTSTGVISNSSNSGEFDGAVFSFASTQPPTLRADIKKYPLTKTSPFAGQSNVDPSISTITLEFDTNVGVLDDLSTNQYTGELWNRGFNTKVADLKLNTVIPVTPYLSPTIPAVQGSVVGSTVGNVYPKLVFDIVNKNTLNFGNDSVFYVKIRQGSYDPISNAGHGITDFGLNFFGGITDNSTLYFKISSSIPINLNSASSNFDTKSVGTLTTNFDQLGTAYYFIVNGLVSKPGTGTITSTAVSSSVTGTGTLFTTELAVGSVLRTPSGTVIGTINSIASNTSLTLSIPAAVALTGGAYEYEALGTGTITSNVSSTTVTGVGTLFTSQIVVGSILKAQSGTVVGTVASIASNTSLTLSANATVALTGVVYALPPVAPSQNEILGLSVYGGNGKVAALGSYPITAVNVGQTSTFAANFFTNSSYDVYVFAKNNAQPTPIPALQIYSFPALISNISATQPSTTPNNKTYSICPDSYVTITDPLVVGETTSSSFFGGGTQDFNVLLPTGFEFDVTVKPTVQLIGGDFSSTWSSSYPSNTVLNIKFSNSGSTSFDYIAISGLNIIGKSGSSQGDILWFYGNNVFTSTTPVFSLAKISLQVPTIPDFTNSFWYNNQVVAPFPVVSASASGVFNVAANKVFKKTVNAIPDDYSDPDSPGAARLLPMTNPYLLDPLNNTFASGDYLASFYGGSGVSGDLLTLNAVTAGAAFNISITHTDLNGCATTKNEQYVVYDHSSPISKKLGLTLNSSVDASGQSSAAGTKQDIANTNFPNAKAKPISSQTIVYNELAGYQLLQLTADLPASEIALNNANSSSQIISGIAWRNLIKNVLNAPVAANVNYNNYTWNYGRILNADTVGSLLPSGITNVYDFFKSGIAQGAAVRPSGNNYWVGGSLGKIEFTGAYQSTADNSVYVPFRQDVELFVPAVPLIEITGGTPFYDSLDVATSPNFNSIQYPPTPKHNNNGSDYRGTATFCEFGGTITVTGLPLASAGTSTGSFAIFDFANYDLTKSPLVNTATNPSSVVPLNGGFVDNKNGTATIDPTKIKNGYNDILVTYTYQNNSSPAIGTGYLIIRITPNPVANFTISSAVANSGASTFDAFCLGTPIAFDASVSVSLLAQPSVGPNTNSIASYTWNFGDPNSGSFINSPSGPPAGQSVSTTPMDPIFVQSKTPGAQTYDKPVHIYNVSSTYPVTLSLTSNWGCPSLPVSVTTPVPQPINLNVLYPGSTGQIKVGEIPIAAFSVAKNCVGDLISFDATGVQGISGSYMPSGSSSNSSISFYNWDYNYQIPANSLPNPSPARASLTSSVGASTTYSKDGFYNVQLTTITSLGCQASVSPVISQLLPTKPFNQYFDLDNGGWQALDLSVSPPIPGSTSSKVSWAWGASAGRTNSNFDSPKPENAVWSTSATRDATTGAYIGNEKSALYSPCLILDATIVPRPMISYSSFVNVNGGDGLVLQYSNDDLNILDPKKSWTNLGAIGTGLDWYNINALASSPGSNTSNPNGLGWSGPGNEWIHPKHALEAAISGNQKIILRFALSSVTSNTSGFDGVAIDSVFFGSRTRTILFENFTTTDDGGTASTSDLSSDAAAITTFVQQNISGTQLVNINYHIGFIGMDPFNLDNPADPSSRALYYNVNKVPYAFLDGIHYRDSTKTQPSDLFKDWGQKEYDLNTLQLAKADFLDPSPNTKLTTVTSNPDGTLQVDVNFTPVFNLPFGVRGGTVLQVAILEKQINGVPAYGKVTTGETSFGYVLKKMLPDASGSKFTSPILGIESNGTTHPVSAGSFTWIPKNLHSDTLTVVAFLQNEDTKEVYQAFIKNVAVPPPATAIEPITADNIKVYPNPSDQEFTIELPSPAQQSMKVTMANQLGQFTEVGAISEGDQNKKISTQGLAEGVYILQLGSNGNALRTKVVVLHK